MQSPILSRWLEVIYTISTRTLVLIIPMLVTFLCGCFTPPKGYHFNANSITRVNYNPDHCVEQSDGRFKCKDVVFTVGSIEPTQK